MQRFWISIILLVYSATAWCGEGQHYTKPVWLVVTRKMFIDEIKPLVEKRKKDGYKVVCSTSSVKQSIQNTDPSPSFLLLVGDCEKGKEDTPWYIPTLWRKLYRWRKIQDEEFASDMLYGDMDNDLIPDIPVGRLPVRNKGQVKAVISKIISYEKQPRQLSDLNVIIWAGAPGYSAVVDAFAMNAVRVFIGQNLPQWIYPRLILADRNDPFCSWPSMQPELFADLLKEGGVVSLMVGHSTTSSFFSMRYNRRSVRFGVSQLRFLSMSEKILPPIIQTTCYTGNFTCPSFSLAKEMFLLSKGPVAVIGATTESQPLTNGYTDLCLASELGSADHRLGVFFLNAQKKMLTYRNFIMEKMLKNAEGKLEENINIKKLKCDQILMYVILGDPATRLKLPEKLICVTEKKEEGVYWKAGKPSGADMLYVTFKPDNRKTEMAANSATKEQAEKRYKEADKVYEFTVLERMEKNKEWKGMIDKNGILRLVAIGSQKSYVYSSMIRIP